MHQHKKDVLDEFLDEHEDGEELWERLIATRFEEIKALVQEGIDDLDHGRSVPAEVVWRDLGLDPSELVNEV